MAIVQPILGITALVAVAWAISENRRGFPWRTAVAALIVQFAVALILIKLPGSQIVFRWIGNGVDALLRSTEAGTSLVFGYLGGAPLPFEESFPGAAFVFAFRVLPMVVFVSALSAVLYHYRVLPWVVRGFAWALVKTLNISGAVSFSTAANVFIGMVEAPLAGASLPGAHEPLRPVRRHDRGHGHHSRNRVRPYTPLCSATSYPTPPDTCSPRPSSAPPPP